MADEVVSRQRVVGAGERGAVVGLGGVDRGDLDGPGGDAQQLLVVHVALVDARDAGADLDRQGVGHVGRGDVGGVGRPLAVGLLVLDRDVMPVLVDGRGGAGHMGRPVVGLHDVGGRDRHVAGDAGGRDEERAGGVLDGVVGRGVGAVGRQDGRLAREGAGVAGVGVGQRALGGVAHFEGLALDEAHGLDAGDLLLGARVFDGLRLALEGDAALSDVQLAGVRSGDDIPLSHIGEANGILSEHCIVRASLGALGTCDDALGVKPRTLGVAGKARDALLGAVIGDIGGGGSELDVLVVGDPNFCRLLLDCELISVLPVHRRVALNRNCGLGVFLAPRHVVDNLGRSKLDKVAPIESADPHVVNGIGKVGARRPLGGQDVLGALVEIVDDNLLAGFKDAAVRGTPTGERMSRNAMRHGSLKAQVSGAGQHHALVVDERVDNRLAEGVACLEGDGRGSLSDTPCGGQGNDTVIARKLARHVKRSTGLDERAVLHKPAEEVGRALGSHKVGGAGDLDLGAVCIRRVVERQRGTGVEVAHMELAVVEPLARDVGVAGNAGLGAEQFAVVGVPAVERVVGAPHRACGQEVRSRTRAGVERGRALVPGLRVLRSAQVPAQRDLVHGPLGIHRDVGMRHGGVGEVERNRAGLVGIPTHKRALDAIGVRVLRDVVGIRRKRRSVVDADDLVVAAGHVMVGEVVGLERVGDIDGRCVLNLLTLGRIALVRPERIRGRVALNPTGSVLVQVVAGVLLVHRQRAAARCHCVDKRKRAVGLLVVVVDRTAALLARAVEVARRDDALGVLHVVRVVRVPCRGEVIAGQKDAARSRSCITTPPRNGIGRIPIVVIRPFTALERSSVQAGEALDELGAPLLVHLEIFHRAQHAVVVDVHDGGAVTGDGDIGLGVVGVEGKAGVALVVGTGNDGTGRSRLLGGLNEVVRLGGVGGVLVVAHALLPVVDGVGNLDGRPVSSESHGSVEHVAFADLRVAQVPTLERIPGARAHGKGDTLVGVHEHMVNGGTASGVKGDPHARDDNGKHVDMVRVLRHCHRSQQLVAIGVRPAHNAVRSVDVVLDARDVVRLMVLDDHRAHDLHAVGVVEVDVQDGGIARIHVVRHRRVHGHGLREVHEVLAQVPTGECLAVDLGGRRLDKRLAVLDGLRAHDGGAVGGQEAVSCQVDGVLIGNDVDREVVDVEALDVGTGLACGDCLNAGGVVGHAVHTHGLALAHAGVEEAHAHGAVGLNGVAILVDERDIESHGAFKRAPLLLDDTGHGGSDVSAVHGLGQHARTLGQSTLGGRHLHGDVARVGVAEESGVCGLLGLGGGLFGRGGLCCRLLSGSGLDCGLLSGSGRGRLLSDGLLGRRGRLLGCGLLGRICLNRRLLRRSGLGGGLLGRSRLGCRLLGRGFSGSRGLLGRSGLCRRLGNRGSLYCGLLGRCRLYCGLSNNLRRTCSLYLGYRFDCRRADAILLFALRGAHCGAFRSRLTPVALRQGRGHHRHLGPHHDQRHENGEYLAYVFGTGRIICVAVSCGPTFLGSTAPSRSVCKPHWERAFPAAHIRNMLGTPLFGFYSIPMVCMK